MSIDWVAARTECSLLRVFEKLRLEIQEDADKRTTWLVEHGCDYGFVVVPSGQSFGVLLQDSNINKPVNHRSIVFRVTDTDIDVATGDGEQICKATVTLSDDLGCRLKVGNRELESWQFRKTCLEDLFFGNPKPKGAR